MRRPLLAAVLVALIPQTLESQRPYSRTFFIPGLAQDAFYWAPARSTLQQTLDLGRTSIPNINSHGSIATQRGWLELAIRFDTLQGKAILVDQSFGGLVARATALTMKDTILRHSCCRNADPGCTGCRTPEHLPAGVSDCGC